MAEPSPEEETLTAVRRTYQEVFDLLIFVSDEMETGRLPTRDGASAVRIAAALVALTCKLT
jgi:hypothetical protein